MSFSKSDNNFFTSPYLSSDFKSVCFAQTNTEPLTGRGEPALERNYSDLN